MDPATQSGRGAGPGAALWGFALAFLVLLVSIAAAASPAVAPNSRGGKLGDSSALGAERAATASRHRVCAIKRWEKRRRKSRRGDACARRRRSSSSGSTALPNSTSDVPAPLLPLPAANGGAEPPRAAPSPSPAAPEPEEGPAEAEPDEVEPTEAEPEAGEPPPPAAGEEETHEELEAEEEGAAEEAEAPEEAAEEEATEEEAAEEEATEEEPAEEAGPVEPHRFYAPSSYWNTPVPAGAPLDPESRPLMDAFLAEVESEFERRVGPGINTTEWSVPLYRVPADQPLEKVTLDAPNAPALQEAFDAVPIPPDAKPAVGTDAKLVVWQPASDKVWEFWRASREADGWHADWGGATQQVSEAAGYYSPQSWPGAKSWWGDSSTSMGVIGGLITFENFQRGVINHALQMAIPDGRAGAWAWPAQRSDGTLQSPASLPLGAHLRLDPDLDLATLPMPPVTRMLAEAAQRYGIFVFNRAHDIAFNAEDPTRTGGNPYRGPAGYFEGLYPRQILAYFPWDHLQLLQMSLSGPAAP